MVPITTYFSIHVNSSVNRISSFSSLNLQNVIFSKLTKELENDPDLQMGKIIVVLFTQHIYLKSGIHFKISAAVLHVSVIYFSHAIALISRIFILVFTWITCLIKIESLLKETSWCFLECGTICNFLIVILFWKGEDGGKGRCGTVNACNADHNGREVSGMYRLLLQWHIVGWNPCRSTDVCAFSVF